jgi:hypothetical protein
VAGALLPGKAPSSAMRGSWGLRGTSESPFWGEGAGSRPKPATRGDGELNFDGSSGGWERWKLILEEPASGPAIAVDSFGSFFPSSSSNGLPSLDYWRSDLGLQFAFQIVPSRDPRAYYTSLNLTSASPAEHLGARCTARTTGRSPLRLTHGAFDTRKRHNTLNNRGQAHAFRRRVRRERE